MILCGHASAFNPAVQTEKLWSSRFLVSRKLTTVSPRSRPCKRKHIKLFVTRQFMKMKVEGYVSVLAQNRMTQAVA